MQIESGFPLSRLTTIGTGGTASALARPATLAELEDAITWATERGLEVATVGLGSNVLAADDGVDALVIRLEGDLAAVSIDRTLLSAGGGATNAVCLHRARVAGLGGLEFACAIPGTAGGGVRMNAGAYGSDWATILERNRCEVALEADDERVDAVVRGEDVRAETDRRDRETALRRPRDRVLRLGERRRPGQGARRAAGPDRRRGRAEIRTRSACLYAAATLWGARQQSRVPHATVRLRRASRRGRRAERGRASAAASSSDGARHRRVGRRRGHCGRRRPRRRRPTKWVTIATVRQ